MRKPRKRRLGGMPFNRMIPNILTLLALSAGMTAMRFALEERWEPAVIAIFVAAILDGLDGRVARLLKGSSKFGAELDSLSDFICFGVAPAIMLYLWTLQSIGRFGWIIAVLYAVCCALRLARFNTDIDEPAMPPWAYNFFRGVPSPAAAGLVLLPMMLSFELQAEVFNRPEVVAVFMLVVSALMVSRIPTFSFKKFRVANRWVLPTMLFAGIFATSLVTAPWMTMSVVLIAYAASIPFGTRSYNVLLRRANERPDRKGDKTD